MKWIALFAALGIVVPVLARKGARSRDVRVWVMRVLAFDLFHPAHVNLLSDETYRGDARGFEITSVDVLLLSLFFAARARGRPTSARPLLATRLLYLGAVLLSVIASPDALRSMFGVWKLARMYFAFAVLAAELVDMSIVLAALQGLALGVMGQGLMALHQRYLLHIVRVSGSQSHPNSLAMIVNLVAPIAFALLLSGHGRWMAMAAFALAGVADVLTLSRGGMLMFVLASGLVALGSLARSPTPRKARILGGMVAGGAVLLGYSAKTIALRFATAPKESEKARELFVAAAKLMAGDHPFGVGINMYPQVLAASDYAVTLGIDPNDRSGIAHHIYWLTAAETGYVGLAAFVLLLAAVYALAVRAALQRGLPGEIGLGLVVGLTVTYVQGTAEWILRQTTMSYAFWLVAAMAVAITSRARSRVSAT